MYSLIIGSHVALGIIAEHSQSVALPENAKFLGTIEFRVELDSTGARPVAIKQEARLFVGSEGDLRLDVWAQDTKDPMVVAIRDGHAWMVAPHNDLVVHGPVGNIDETNPWGRMLAAQVRQLLSWKRDLLDGELPVYYASYSIDPQPGTIEFSTSDCSYRVIKENVLGFPQDLVTQWISISKSGATRSARLSDFQCLGSGMIAGRGEFDTENPNGETSRSIYTVTKVFGHRPDDPAFQQSFVQPSSSTSDLFHEVKGQLELRGDGTPEKVVFFSNP